MFEFNAIRIWPISSRFSLIATCFASGLACGSADASVVTIPFSGFQDSRLIGFGPHIGSFPNGQLVTGTYTLDTTKTAYRPGFMTAYYEALVTSTVRFHGGGLAFTTGPGGTVYVANERPDRQGDMVETIGGIAAGGLLGGTVPISLNLQFADFSGRMLATDAIPTKKLDYEVGLFGLNTTLGWTQMAVRPVPSIYGVFLGINDIGVNGKADAQNLFDAMASNLLGFKKDDSILILRDRSQGVNKNEIEFAINQVAAKMKTGDKFIIFGSSHGGTSPLPAHLDETTDSPGDEFLTIQPNDYLYDDDLKQYLSAGNLTDKEKWVMLDACSAGGFWGNENPNDLGDLEKLSNIALFAAASENDITGSAVDTWEGLFSAALTDGFRLRADGEKLKADLNRDGALTFLELKDWLDNYYLRFPDKAKPFVIERVQGDLVPFTPDMWSPKSAASPDFGGVLFGYVPNVPEPNTFAMMLAGLGLVGLIRRRSRAAAASA